MVPLVAQTSEAICGTVGSELQRFKIPEVENCSYRWSFQLQVGNTITSVSGRLRCGSNIQVDVRPLLSDLASCVALTFIYLRPCEGF